MTRYWKSSDNDKIMKNNTNTNSWWNKSKAWPTNDQIMTNRKQNQLKEIVHIINLKKSTNVQIMKIIE